MFLALLCALPVPAATVVRSKADLRLWETAQDRSLAWPWAPGADTAALAFSNRVTRSVAAVAVPRGEGETRGCCELPAEWSAGDAIVDISLVQTRGGAEVARESATVAFVPGAGGIGKGSSKRASSPTNRPGTARSATSTGAAHGQTSADLAC